ncbi:hypothetical protein [Paraburkholderia jirisanensis]
MVFSIGLPFWFMSLVLIQACLRSARAMHAAAAAATDVATVVHAEKPVSESATLFAGAGMKKPVRGQDTVY